MSQKKIKEEYFLKIVVPALEKKQCMVKKFNAGSYRITNGIDTVDYYPGSMKLFMHYSQDWAVVKNNVLGEILTSLNISAL